VRVRRGAIVMLILIGVAAAAATTLIAIFVPWLPTSASEERDGIDLVFWVTTAICIGIFSVVAAVSIYAGVKFRVRADDDSDGPPIHGHTGLEIVWTAVPAVLVTVIAVLSAIVLAQNQRTSGEVLRVTVTAQQFAWSFEYPDSDVASGNLVIPVGRSTRLELGTRDVIHSFWVPEFGQKQDAVRGISTSIVITPTRIGEYPVICTELCGLGHSLMRSRAIVLSESDFRAWLREQRARPAPFAPTPPAETEPGETEPDETETAPTETTPTETEPGETEPAETEGEGAAAAREAFVSNCGSCHTLAKAGTNGRIGPPLDRLTLDEQAIERQIREGGGGMPPFEGQLTDDQIEALVEYLRGGTG
jgi:cytochrome c oxidase subunit 2